MALESLKDAYYSLEGKIGRTGVIGLAIAIIVIIAVIAWLLLMPPVSGQMKKIDLRISDSSGAVLEGVVVKYTINEIPGEKISDSAGNVSFEAPLDSSVLVEISGQAIGGTEFEGHRESFTISEDVSREISLQAASATAVEKTIIFKGTNNARITGKLITVRLSCANGFAISPGTATDSDKDGVIRVLQPKECDALNAIVTGPSEFKQATITVDAEPKTALLEAVLVDSPKGTLRVTVKGQAGDLITGTSFTVTVRAPDGATEDEKETGAYGEAIFADIPTGAYNVAVTDYSGTYGIANLFNAMVSAGQTKEVSATVSRNITRVIKVSVLDKASNAKIRNATVQLIDAGENIIAEDSTGEDGNTVSFPLAESGTLSVFAMHEEYIYEKVALGETDSNVTLKLEKITPENSRIIRVKVVDEDGKAVEGAKVALRALEDGVLATPYKSTDYNGLALFAGMKQAKYYAYASKEPVAFADNKDYAAEPSVREITDFYLELVIGNATLKLSAVNSDDEPITEVEAEIFSADGKSLGRVPMPQGSADYTMKADKKVYVVFRHSDYAKVQALPQQLWPDREFEFKATMLPKAISGSLKIDSDGIYGKDGEKTTMFSSGEKYLAVFKVTVPENAFYAKLGIHFRVGDEKFFDNEPLAVIDGVAGNPAAITKGLAFTQPMGYETDSKNLTEGDAKWINIAIDNAESGVYYFGVYFRVKKTALPSTLLTMHYRAYGIDSSNVYTRAPADTELGNSENTQAKQALYAKTIDNLRFYEGETPICGEEFCYSGEWVFDNLEKLYLDSPYEGILLADYNFHFGITNNSDKAFENAELNIRNYTGDESKEELKFKAYIIEDAAGKKTSNFSTELDRIEKINLGKFLKGTGIAGNVLFRTLKIGPGKINIYIIADGRKVFDRTIDFKINSNKKMTITLDPDTIPSFVETKIKATVAYRKDSGETLIEGAKVILTKTSPDSTKNIFTATTDSLGNAVFIFPASSPKTRLSFVAEKTGYFSEPLEREIAEATISFDPAAVSAELDTRKATEAAFDEKAINETGADFTIDSITMAGKIAKTLDTGAMYNYSENFRGRKIKALETTEFEKLLLVRLRAEAAKELAQNMQMDGNFWIVLAEEKSGKKFDFQVPLRLGINIADLPKEACIALSTGEWAASTQGNKATLEFEVQNNCEADGQMLALENLMARIAWSSAQNGTVELSLTDSETGEANTETLSTGWSKLFGRVRPGSVFSGFLTFTPKQGSLGKDAQFAVEIDGQMLSSGGLKFVGATPKSINSVIKIINLEQCLQSKEADELLKIAAGTKETKFSLDSSGCGETDIEISLCREDSGKCSGGAEGSIQLSKTEFTLTPDKPKMEITAFAGQIPGMYGIVVEAKVPGKGWQRIRAIDLLVEPGTDSVFSLDKYAFVIKGTGSRDSATLSNKNVVETVTIDASACDWTEGQKNCKGKENSSMLPLAAMPLMMGVLPPLMNAMNSGTQGIVQGKEEPAAITSTDSVKKASDDISSANNGVGDIKEKIDGWGKGLGDGKASSFGPAEKTRRAVEDLDKKINGAPNSDGVKQGGLVQLTASAKTLAEQKYTEADNAFKACMAANPTTYSTACAAQIAKKTSMLKCTTEVPLLETQNKKLNDSLKKIDAKNKECFTNDGSPFKKAMDSTKDASDKSKGALGAAPDPKTNPDGTGIRGVESNLNNAIEKEKIKDPKKISDAQKQGQELIKKQSEAMPGIRNNLQGARDALAGKDSSTPGLQQNLEGFGKCIKDDKGTGLKDQLYKMNDDLQNDLISKWNAVLADCKDLTGLSQFTKLNTMYKDVGKSANTAQQGLYDSFDPEKQINPFIKDKVNPLVGKIDGTTANLAENKNSASDLKISLADAPAAESKGYLGDLDKAKSDLTKAGDSKTQLSNATKPLQGVAQKAAVDPAMNQAMMNMMNQAMMAAMMGSMLGGGNSCGDDTDPCNDRMQMPVTAWVINLNENSQPITMDKTGISAYWENDNMKLIGQYERQD
ncbi:MAG: carboxypeptidase-like regulatory domain-containing protein, partial [Candidatus ainarchaeum sp.]|nr:carboxypeptidase-like regulatory domain-containing protein [Candidatus ainarchaeum sp.]